MELPNLPTDNLYKFMSLTGIMFVVFFYVYPLTRIDRIRNEQTILVAEQGKLNASTEILKLRQNSLLKDLLTLEKKIDDKYGKPDSLDKLEKKPRINLDNLWNNLHDKEYREYLKFTFDYEKKIIPEKNELQLLKSMTDSINEIGNKQKLILVDIKSKNAQISEKIKQERNWLWMEIIGLSLGLILIILGFKFWYYKVQIPLDEKLRLENELLKINIKKEKTNQVDTKA
jgi:hypothetical protein